MRRLVLGALTVLAATACGGSADPLGSVGDDTDAVHGAWELASAEPSIEVPDGARVTLAIERRDGGVQVGGTAACNSYGGTVDLADGHWSTSGLGATEMACEPPLMDVERAYLDTLRAVDGWARDGDSLRLDGGAGTLVFQRLPEVEPATFTGTDWVLDGIVHGNGQDASVASPTAGVEPAEVRFEDDGTFTLFSGCRDFAGEWTTRGDEVALTSWGQVEGSRGIGPDGELTCSADAEDQERDVLRVTDGFTAVVEGQRLTLRRGDRALVLRPAD